MYERFGMSNFQASSSRAHLALCCAELGQFNEGIAPGEEGLRLAEALNHPQSIAVAYWCVSHLYVVEGDLTKAIPLAERAVEVCRMKQVAAIFPDVASNLGYAYLHSGRTGEGAALLEESVEAGVKIAQMYNQSARLARLSEAYLLAGRMDAAIESAGRALKLSRDHTERGHEAWALRLLGELAAREDPPDVKESEDYYRQALALAEELGMRPLQAQCNVGLGKLYRRKGDLRLAKEHLNTGVAMMREMQMGLWLEMAEAELKELS